MALSYARYVEHLAKAAREIYDTGFKSWCAQYAMPLHPQERL